MAIETLNISVAQAISKRNSEQPKRGRKPKYDAIFAEMDAKIGDGSKSLTIDLLKFATSKKADGEFLQSSSVEGAWNRYEKRMVKKNPQFKGKIVVTCGNADEILHPDLTVNTVDQKQVVFQFNA